MLLSVRELTKFYGDKDSKHVVRAVDKVSFDLPEDCTLGIVGESGCGKTTVGRCILGLLKLTDGQIFYRGKEISVLPPEKFRPFRKDIQMVFQNPHDALNPRMRIRKLLAEPLELWGDRLSPQELRHKMSELLKSVHLDESTLNRYPHQLSGGQLQRICIAMAIASNPKLIVLDEPTTSLDAENSADLIDLLVKLKKQLKNSYIFISHDLHAVSDICDTIAVMYLGRVVEIGPRDQIFNHPRHPYTQALMGSMLSINKSKDEIVELEGEVPSPIHLPQGCYFHSRCVNASEKCRQQYPHRTILAEGGYVHCWKVDEEETIKHGRKRDGQSNNPQARVS